MSSIWVGLLRWPREWRLLCEVLSKPGAATKKLEAAGSLTKQGAMEAMLGFTGASAETVTGSRAE